MIAKLCLAAGLMLAAGAARADVKSGPKAGDKVPALKAFGVVGKVEGKEADFAAARKDAPTVYVFVQAEADGIPVGGRPAARFLKALDGQADKLDGAAVVAVWLGDQAFDAHKQYLPRIGKSLTFAATQLAAFDGDKAGPAGWEVNADAHLTAVVAHKGKVVKSFAFVSVDETDVRGVVAALKDGLAAGPKVHRDLAYAEPKTDKQTLDVFAPAGGKGHPVVVWVHGGGWQQGDKADVDAKPRAFVDRGYVFVSVNYRLLPAATISQMAGDVAKAIRWVHDHARDYGGDPDTMFVGGHSAGAQLAALVCTDDGHLKAEKLPLSLIKGCLPVDGDTYDVPLQIQTVERRRADIYRTKFGAPDRQTALSPVTHAAKGKGTPPFLILHVADHPETKAQSRRLAGALQAAAVPVKVYPAEGKTHQTINADLGTPDDEATRRVFEFLEGVRKK